MASDLAWPALRWEEQSWVPRMPPEMVSRRVRERHTGPYRSAVVPAIAGVELSGKRRARLWQASEVLSALDDFAARAGRRGL